ncbi:MAG: hypothetical protein U0105_22805 [Candidatus Obscuribacterales bacterium]
MDPKPFKPDTTDGIDSVELKESPRETESDEPQPAPTSAATPAASSPTGKKEGPKKKNKPGRAGDLGLAIIAIVLAAVLSVTNYLIGPVSETPRNIGYLGDVPKTGDAVTLLKLKLRLARGIILPATLNAANMDIANYYLWVGNVKGAESYLDDARGGDDYPNAAITYSELGLRLDQKQWQKAAQVADEWFGAIDQPYGPSRIPEFELIQLAYLHANRQDDVKRVEELIDRARFLDDSHPSLQPPPRFGKYDEQAGLSAVCKSAENAMAAGAYSEALRYWRFVLDSTPAGGYDQLTSYEHEKARLMLPVASFLAGDKAAAAKQFPAALNSLSQYSDWFTDTQKGVVYKYYASLLRQQGAVKPAAQYEEMANKLLNPQPVKPWWDEQDPYDPWNQVSL